MSSSFEFEGFVSRRPVVESFLNCLSAVVCDNGRLDLSAPPRR